VTWARRAERHTSVGDRLLKLIHGVLCVLGLENLVELPEAERRLVRHAAVLEHDAWTRALVQLCEAVNEVVPEPGVRPMLDGERGAEGDVGVVGAVDLIQRVAKLNRVLRAVLALAQIIERKAD